MITTNATDLRRALTTLNRVAPRRPTMPALGYVMLDTEAGGLIATDLDVTQLARIPLETAEPARALLDLKPLRASLKGAKGPVTIELPESAGLFATVATSAGTFRVHTLDVSDFPTLPDRPTPDAFTAIDTTPIRAVAYAMSADETRYHLNGVLLEPSAATATDGHRLATYAHAFPVSAPVIVPRLAVSQLCREKATDARLAIAGPVVHLETAAGWIAAREVDGEFPDWHRVVPDTSAPKRHSVNIPAGAMLDACRAVSAGAKRADGHSVYTFTGSGIMAERIDKGEIVASAPVSLAESVNGLDGTRIGFNAFYLIDAFSPVAAEPATVRASLATDAQAMFEHGDYRAIVMPTRL